MGEGPLGGAGEDPLDQFGGILAAPPRHPVRRAVVGAGAVIVAIAAAIAAVIAVNQPATAARPVPSRHPAGLIALTDPGAGPNDDASGVIAFNRDGTMLATGGGNGQTYLWDVATSRLVATLAGPHAGVSALAFSPDGATLAAGYSRGVITLWNVAHWTVSAILTVPDAVVFNPSGTMVAVGDGIGAIYLFSTAGWSDGAILGGPDGAPVQGVAFSPDGRMLAAGDSYGTTYLWPVS
jgi:hypothetical protein